MFTVQNHRGRLIEVRMRSCARSPVTMDEIDGADGTMGEILRELTPFQAVVCGDYSQASILPASMANRLAEVFRHYTPRVERSGLLVAADSAVAVLQMERLIRHADNPGRKAFRHLVELKEWLSDVLDVSERARLEKFFQSGKP
jgi:hypothetical protein